MVLQQWKVVLWDLPQGGWGMSDGKSHQGNFGPLGTGVCVGGINECVCDCTA